MTGPSPLLIHPDWPVPAHVAAVCTTRVGGVSVAPFDSLNLGDHVGDDPVAVATNRAALVAACSGLHAISWLQQVHGIEVVAADAAHTVAADAQFSRTQGLGCAVMTADCLPVLFCDRQGTQVAAAHAGWRGLCAGVLEQTVATFPDPANVLAWLGPAIGPAAFEVGAEVRDQFLAQPWSTGESVVERAATADCFHPASKAGLYLADIYSLARLRLMAAGVTSVYGGELCTVADPSRFYSYRRDGVTGRIASLIYLMPSADDRPRVA